jgi:hypothetical protein
MFAYNAGGVQDRSGEILGAGSAQAAQINAQMLAQFGQDMGGMMNTFAEAYKQKEQDKSDARIYGQLLKFVAPAFGQQGDAVLQEYNSLKRDRDKANYGRTVSQLLGPASNALMAQRSAGIRENAPFVGAGLKNAANIAGGNATYTPPAGMAPVEPPLPTGGPAPSVDTPLPALAGAPTPAATPAPAIPGGRASWDAANRRRAANGLKPLPYPPGI